MGTTPQYQTDANAGSLGALLKLDPRGVSPPANGYLYPGSGFIVRTLNAISGLVLQLSYMVLLPEGRLVQNVHQLTTNGTRAGQSLIIALPEGFLVQLTVRCINNFVPNRIFVQVGIITSLLSATTNVQVICQGYLNNFSWLWWPGGANASSTEGAGAINSVTGTLPSAGAEISETVPTGAIWQLKAFTFKLTTSATVANRIPHLIIDDGTNVLLDAPAPSTAGASGTTRYVTGDNAIAAAVLDSTMWLQSVAALRLLPGYRIRTLTTSLQAADQYTAPQYLVTEWLET